MTAEKIVKLVERPIATLCFAVPGQTMIDEINPATGRSAIYGSTLEQIRDRYPGAEIMEIDAFLASKAAVQDTPIVWTECTEESYEENLCVLPPAAWTKAGFLVGEACDHHAMTGQPRFQAFIVKTTKGDGWSEKRYYQSSRPMTITEFKAL